MALENIKAEQPEVEETAEFDLGEYMQPAAATKPRIHVAPGESACISCEG
jgi:hypothetical protein